ncbi:MAG: hypothetical protein J6A89_07390 [Clostridia bacterium]|nr:hypothetical protein [Clostridia bacterium]
MNTKEEKFLTINNYNIIGRKTDIDINIIKQYPKLEEIKIKNFDISNELIELLNNLQNLKKIFLVNCTINANKTINENKNIRIK